MSVPQRDAIIASVVTALDAITAGQMPTGSSTTYNTTPTVELAARDGGDKAIGTWPWIGVVPQEGPAPEYKPFGVMRCKLPIDLVCHVQAASTTEKAEKLADLEDDIIAALNVDTRRGGLAICTTVTIGMRGNDADPDVKDARNVTCSGVMRIEVEYERTVRLTAA